MFLKTGPTPFFLAAELCLFTINLLNEFVSWISGVYHPSGHHWDYYPGALSLSQIRAAHLKSGHPLISSTCAQCSNELQRLCVKSVQLI